jgi:hypothetical protein
MGSAEGISEWATAGSLQRSALCHTHMPHHTMHFRDACLTRLIFTYSCQS